MQKGFTPMLILIIIIVISAVAAGGYFFVRSHTPKSPTQTPSVVSQKLKACTEEAKICPNGSSVGRIGPNCEFALCPTLLPVDTANWKLVTESRYYSIKIPGDYQVNRIKPVRSSGLERLQFSPRNPYTYIEIEVHKDLTLKQQEEVFPKGGPRDEKKEIIFKEMKGYRADWAAGGERGSKATIMLIENKGYFYEVEKAEPYYNSNIPFDQILSTFVRVQGL